MNSGPSTDIPILFYKLSVVKKNVLTNGDKKGAAYTFHTVFFYFFYFVVFILLFWIYKHCNCINRRLIADKNNRVIFRKYCIWSW